MQRFQNIVVVAGGKDGGLAAVKRATDLAVRNSARLTIVDVLEPLPPLHDLPGALQEEMQSGLTNLKNSELESLAEAPRRKRIKVDTKLLVGSPAEQIVGQVVAAGHDLLVKSAEEPSGVFERLFGSTGKRLMRRCPCPVWVIKAGAERRFHRVLAAVEPRPLDQQRDPLNVKILELATSLAESDCSELHVVYVWPHWTESVVPDSNDIPPADLAMMRRKIDNLQERMLSKLIAPFREAGQIDQVHLLKGRPGDRIAALAEKLKIELLVMGSVCRTGVTGIFIGDTAERVLDQVNCSVLTVKPHAFAAAVKANFEKED